MALNWPTFFTRLSSAIVFAIVMMVGLLWKELVFASLALLIQFLCLREYLRLTKKIVRDENVDSRIAVWTHVVAISIFIAPAFYSPVAKKNYVVLTAIIPIIIFLFAVLNKKTSLVSVWQSFSGLFYITLPMMLFVALRLHSIVIPLALVLMIWMNDTMAYLVGSFIGKTPFSAISPKKTWEGTVGGALLTIIGTAIWGHYSHYYQMQDWIVLALCASVAGTAGDLLESKLKRMANVKDSGVMMPGHGGALDRFDSLLVAIPFAFVYVYFFMPPLHLSIF